MSKKKYYVVWRGRCPGVYATWEECLSQVHKAAGAQYKSYATLQEAQAAFTEREHKVVGDAAPKRKSVTAEREGATKKSGTRAKLSKTKSDLPANPPSYRNDTVLPLPMEVSADAIAVDAACSGNPGMMEYRGVDLATGAEVFHFGPIYGTNNIGEFLAIVHALALFAQQGIERTIYSDSRNAMLWVNKGKCKTTLKATPRTQEVLSYVARAEHFLATHGVSQKLLKWDTRHWGEIPADFGRK